MTYKPPKSKLPSKANWANQTIWTSDNLPIMRGMNSGCVDLIYLDPPFNSKANYAAPIGSKAAGAAFKDTWTLSDVDVEWINLIEAKEPALYRVLLAAMTNSNKSYLAYMAARLLEMRRILKPTGSIYLHCDPTMSHYLKTVMDAIFGRRNFRNEIIWCYTQGGRPKQDFPRKHDTIFRYSKSDNYVFNAADIKIPYELISEKSSDSFTKKDEHGRWYKEIYGPDKKKKYRYYKDEGKVPYSWWSDIPQITGRASVSSFTEKTGYPTQKPLTLLNRIIKASSNEGDMVLDPFCGCATACIAAEKEHRQWAGIDISPKAAQLVQSRMRNEVGLFFKGAARKDIPNRTDIVALKRYNHVDNRRYLYGEQSGNCAGCKVHFEARHLEVDHIIARQKGGTDHIENLQLLCGSCNRIKGDRGMEYLRVKLEIAA